MAKRSRRRATRAMRYRRPLFEAMEPRLCLSSISGVVWHDLDASGTRDKFVVGSEPDVVMVIDASTSTGGGFGRVGICGQKQVATTGSGDWETVTVSFTDPVIIVSPVSSTDDAPATARVSYDPEDPSQFSVQVDEWEYEDQSHSTETLNYLVIEAGQHQLDDGTIIEADTIEADSTGTWVSFNESFSTTPIVLVQVMTNNEAEAATARISDLSPAGFYLTLQEEEASDGQHAAEVVGYVAITETTELGTETGYGKTYNGVSPGGSDLTFQAGTLSGVDEAWNTLDYEDNRFSSSATSQTLIFASMQTTADSDPAAIRYQNASYSGVQLKVQEETSDDAETDHGEETVGFLAIQWPQEIYLQWGEEGEIWVDIDNDQTQDTILEAEIVACAAVNEKLIELGLGDVADVVLVTFNDSADYPDLDPIEAGVQFHTTPNANKDHTDNPDFLDIENALNAISMGGAHTFFAPPLSFAEAALSNEMNYFVDPPAVGLGPTPQTGANGNVLFLSDGRSGAGGFGDLVEDLGGWANNIRAFGVGYGAVLDNDNKAGTLLEIDPTAQQFMTPYGLIQAMVNAVVDEYGDRVYVEPGMENVTVFLDTDNDAVLDANEASTTTDENGLYAFTGLVAGTYHVRQVVPSGFAQTYPTGGASQTVVLTADENAYLIDFGNKYATDVAAADSAVTDEDTSVLIDVLDNDTTPSGMTRYFSRVNDPEHGTTKWNGSTVEYTPDADWNGTDTFSYVVTLGEGLYFKGTVTVTVNPVNDAPEIEDTAFASCENESIVGTLASDIDGDVLTCTRTGPNHGSVVINGDGTFTYTPEEDWYGIDRTTVEFSDGEYTLDPVEILLCVSAITDDVAGSEQYTPDASVPAYSSWGSAVAAGGDLMVVGQSSVLGDCGCPVTLMEHTTSIVIGEDESPWEQLAEFSTEQSEDYFGCSVAVAGSTVVVGARKDDHNGLTEAGAVYVCTEGSSGWEEVKLTAPSNLSNSYDYFGCSVAINENATTIVVGAQGRNSGAGAAYVYTYGVLTGWTYAGILTASDPTAGALFGCSVDIDGIWIIVGASGALVNGDSTGAAYLFEYQDGSWTFAQKQPASDPSESAYFGCAVAIDGDRAVVGASGDVSSKGAAYVFELGGSGWSQTNKITLGAGAQGDKLGTSVDLSGDLILVGAPGSDSEKGAAYLFELDQNTWTLAEALEPTLTGEWSSQNFGASVAMGSWGIVVGAPYYSAEGSSYDLQGAAYFFAYNRTPVAEDLEFAVTEETVNGSGDYVDDLFGIDPFEGSTVAYSLANGQTAGATAHGYVSLNAATGQFTYTPASGFYGVDEFTYKVNDGSADSNTATIALYVGDAPVVLAVYMVNTTGSHAGYLFPFDSDQDNDGLHDDQLATVPIGGGVNRVWIYFDRSVGVAAADLVVTNRLDTEESFTAESVTTYGGGWYYWTFNSANRFRDGEMILTLSESVNASGIPLDGEWTNPEYFGDTNEDVSDLADGSGDGTYGGDFVFRFTLLPGDANCDGTVDDLDASIVATHWQMQTGALWTDGDFTGDGKVNDLDASALATHWQASYWAEPELLMMSGGGSGGGSESLRGARLDRVAASLDAVFAQYGFGDDEDDNDTRLSSRLWDSFLDDLFDVLES